MNKDKCALAMSFFANDNSSSKVKKPPKKSSTASSDDLPSVQNASAKPFVKKLPPERAYFEPEGSELPDDEDEDELEVFQSRAASRRKQKSPEPEIDQGPPVPTRSGEPKQMMLRLMKNATNIMRS